MTDIKREDGARRPDELTRDGASRRPSPTIETGRPESAPRPGTPLRANQVAGGDPRYAYLAEPHD